MTRSIQGPEWQMRVDSDGRVQLTLLEARLTPELRTDADSLATYIVDDGFNFDPPNPCA